MGSRSRGMARVARRSITMFAVVTILAALGGSLSGSGAWDASAPGPAAGPESTTPSSSSSGPPTVPQEFLVVARPGFLLLTWKPPVSDGGSSITGYNVYRGTVKAGAKTVIATVPPSTDPTFEDHDIFETVTYYYQLSAVNADGEGPRTGELGGAPLPGLDRPNLRVLSIRIEPTDPGPGDEVGIRVTIENGGGAAAPAALVRVQLDGGLLLERTTTSMPPGASALIETSIVVSAGAHSISAFVDPSNAILEPDELDNYVIRNFIVPEAVVGPGSYLVWVTFFVVALTCSFFILASVIIMRRKGRMKIVWRKVGTPPARPKG